MIFMNEEQKKEHTCACGCNDKKGEETTQEEKHVCTDESCCEGKSDTENKCEGCEEGCEECK